MHELNRNELEALHALWEHGRLKPAEIQAHFGWPIENATLRSVLRVLMGKGLVARSKSGKAFVYQAKASKQGLLVRMARRLSEVFTGGSTASLIAQLMQIEKLSPGEILELRRVAGQKARPTQGPLPRRQAS